MIGPLQARIQGMGSKSTHTLVETLKILFESDACDVNLMHICESADTFPFLIWKHN